jgi:transcription termination factor NusB
MTNIKGQARSAARLAAVQALYQVEMEGTELRFLLDEFHQHRLGAEIEDVEYAAADVEFFDDVVKGVLARRDEIDGLLRRAWRRAGRWPGSTRPCSRSCAAALMSCSPAPTSRWAR